MRRCLDALYLGAGWLAGAFLIAGLCLMLLMAAGRKFGLSIPDGDLFVGWSFAALTFLGLAHTFKSGDMIRVGVLVESLSGRWRWLLELLSLAVALAFTSFFAWHACLMTLESWKEKEPSLGLLATPIWIPQLGMALGIALLALALWDEFFRVVAGLRPSYVKDKPRNAQEMLERAMESGG